MTYRVYFVGDSSVELEAESLVNARNEAEKIKPGWLIAGIEQVYQLGRW